MTAKFQDGDASISRLDMTVFQDTASNPWDVFESFALMVDGKEVATINADNRDDYLDEDTNEIRFSGLNIVSMEDDETEITLVGSIQNNLDSADLGTWDVDATALRYFDADGVATTEISAPVTDDTANFDIKVAGDGEELKFALGSNNPAAQDIVVKDTSATNGITILEYTIEAIDADIELNTLKVNVQTVSAVYSSVVSDIEMDIDGKTFRDDSALSSGTASTNATIGFDINREIKIDAGDKVTVKVKVDFKRQDVNYANGTTIKAQVSTTEVDATDAEGADTITATDLTGSAIGKLHTLVASGIVVPSANFDASFDTQGTNDTIGVFTITFDVKAVDGDFYIAKAATLGTSATTGVEYTVTGPVGYLLGSSTVSAVVSSTEADEDTAGVYTVADGESNTFTLKVTIDPNVAGSYTVTLGGVNYTANANGVTATTLYSPVPSQDFRSGDEVINQ